MSAITILGVIVMEWIVTGPFLMHMCSMFIFIITLVISRIRFESATCDRSFKEWFKWSYLLNVPLIGCVGYDYFKLYGNLCLFDNFHYVFLSPVYVILSGGILLFIGYRFCMGQFAGPLPYKINKDRMVEANISKC